MYSYSSDYAFVCPIAPLFPLSPPEERPAAEADQSPVVYVVVVGYDRANGAESLLGVGGSGQGPPGTGASPNDIVTASAADGEIRVAAGGALGRRRHGTASLGHARDDDFEETALKE